MINRTQSKGVYESLVAQLDKVVRHNRQGSFRTRERYYEAMKRFCRFLAEEYRLQKLDNIAPKHIAAYVEYLQESGKAPSTIKTELSAIRFFHDKLSNPRYTLPSNSELGLERRSFGGVDRTWSAAEFNRMLLCALETNRPDYILAFYLARYAGLRIHECFRIDTAAAEAALRTGNLTVKGKGGKVRTVPINDVIRMAMEKQLKDTKRGHKLLVPDDVETDQAIYDLQQFIRSYRYEVQDPDSERPMTFHGLRHTYAAERYCELIQSDISERGARSIVSHLLGHERPDVTNIYLASLKGGRSRWRLNTTLSMSCP